MQRPDKENPGTSIASSKNIINIQPSMDVKRSSKPTIKVKFHKDRNIFKIFQSK